MKYFLYRYFYFIAHYDNAAICWNVLSRKKIYFPDCGDWRNRSTCEPLFYVMGAIFIPRDGSSEVHKTLYIFYLFAIR